MGQQKICFPNLKKTSQNCVAISFIQYQEKVLKRPYLSGKKQEASVEYKGKYKLK